MSLSLCPESLSIPTKSPELQPSTSLLKSYPPLCFFQSPRRSKIFIRCSAGRTDSVSESAIKRIADKLRSLGYVDQNPQQIVKPETEPEPVRQDSAGEIFVPLPHQLPKYRVGHTIDTSWSFPENPVPSPGSGYAIAKYNELRNEVKKHSSLKEREEEKPTLAELTFSKEELKRLQRSGIGIKKTLKIGKAGITEGIVNGIHERWRCTELVKIACEDLCKMNMKRTHDLLEKKTGGFVIWRSGGKVVLYRGPNYEYPYFLHDGGSESRDSSNSPLESFVEDGHDRTESVPANKMEASLVPGVGLPNRVRFQLSAEKQLVEEADRLLDGLGPRFSDWWGLDPQPVDADLLPRVISGYRRPFRLLPYGVKPKLTNDEMTILKRLGRPLPCHFALGRNRALQGLAAAIIKLWEKCEIAKIAIKRGVQNTSSLLMAEELRRLTGGTLLSRDREFIVLYRGKDFLPMAVSSAIEERRKRVICLEKLRENRGSSVISKHRTKVSENESVEENDQNGVHIPGMKLMQSTAAAINRKGILLSRALEKRAKAENLLSEMEEREDHRPPDIDKEGITQEERYMLRRVGLRMKPFLLLGRRGIFDGTVENMHLHWKYRELVKILCNQKNNTEALMAGRTLEAESGGILVAVERVNKGYAIIVYRGKNYSRPASLRPETLLNKKEAMKRSLEAQRAQSLKLHVLKLNRTIDDLKRQMDKNDETVRMLYAEESKIKSVTEKSLNDLQSSEYERSNSEPDDGFPLLDSCREELIEARDGYDSIDTTDTSVKISQQEKNPTEHDVKIEESETELQNSSISDFSINHVKHTSPEISEPQVCVNQSGSEDPGHHFCENEKIESNNEMKLSGGVNSMPLCNKDRLLLRRQALRVKRRPVLAVGMSNNVSGVAKTIKTHFKKHPLAVINVKARAKGTPIKELVFRLEQATGAIFVSQETNKVILYRGWGAGIEAGGAGKVNQAVGPSKGSVWKRENLRPPVSPELIAAIKSECGLH